jgi:hypothetical protein
MTSVSETIGPSTLFIGLERNFQRKGGPEKILEIGSNWAETANSLDQAVILVGLVCGKE